MFTAPLGLLSSGLGQELSLLFTAPVEQAFPGSSADVTALGLSTPTSLWDLNEAAGNAMDRVASNDLTPVNAPLQAQIALGFWDGATMDGQRAVEFSDGSNESLDAAGAGVFDFDAVTSFAFMIVFRVAKLPVATRSLLGKRLSIAPFTGYELAITSAGHLQATLDDGVAAPQLATIAIDHGDGAWHCALLVVDRNANNLGLWSDRGADGTNPLTVGSLSNAAIFALGQGAALSAAHSQISLGIAWTAANAQGMGQADVDAFWTHGDDPTGLLTDKSHASVLGNVIGYSAGFGTYLGEMSVDDVLLGYNANLSNVNQLGLRCTPDVQNLLAYSDDFTQWTPTNITVGSSFANLDDSPRYFREAMKLTATANNGYVERLYTTIASTDYAQYVFIRRSGGVDVTGRIIMYDNTGAVETGSVAFTATSEWQLFSLEQLTNVGQVSTGFRIEIDISGRAIHVARATAKLGAVSIPVYADGAPTTAAKTDYAIESDVAGRYLLGYSGEIKAVVVCDGVQSPADRYAFDSSQYSAPATEEDRRAFELQPSGTEAKLVFHVYDGAGNPDHTVQSDDLDFTQEHVIRGQWQTGAPIAASDYSRLIVNKLYSGAGAPWAAGRTVDGHYIGSRWGIDEQLDGLLAELHLYPRPQVGKLLNLDFTEPVEQPWPSTVGGLQVLGFPTVDYIWRFEEAAGNALDDIAATPLVPTNSPLQNRVALGFWNGSDFRSKKAVEFDGATTMSMVSTGSALFDFDAVTSFAFMVVFRAIEGNASIFGKRVVAGNTEGYELTISAAGALTWQIYDSAGNSAVATDSANNYADGGWHCVICVCSRDEQKIFLYTDLEPRFAAAAAWASGVGSLSNAINFSVGNGRSNAFKGQVPYLAAWVGTDASELDIDLLLAFWLHATDPNSTIDDTDRPGTLAERLPDEPGFGLNVADFGEDQLVIGYNAGFSHASKLGLRGNQDATNLVTQSEDFSTWAATNITVTTAWANLDDSPRKLREAQKLTATLANGYVEHLYSTLAGTEYSHSVALRRAIGSDVTGRVIAYDNIGAAEIASVPFTATSEWQRFDLTFTTPGGCVQVGFRIEIDTNAEAVFAWGATAKAGKPTSFIHTKGSTVLCAGQRYQIAGSPGELVFSRQEVEAVVICDYNLSSVARCITDLIPKGTLEDRVLLYYEFNERLRMIIRDSSAATAKSIQSAITNPSNEHTVRGLWDANNPLEGAVYARIVLDAVETDAAGAGWTCEEKAEDIYVAGNRSAAQLDGLMATFVTKSEPEV
jgi:hypothetical protein